MELSSLTKEREEFLSNFTIIITAKTVVDVES